jgi:RNA polymerase sigma factor (sigma-70 family)
MQNIDAGNAKPIAVPGPLETFGAVRQDVVRQELVKGYVRYRSMAVRRLGDRVAADDVVQAFALKAFERASQLRNLEAVHGWLRRLFETTLIDFCRRRSTSLRREVTFENNIHDGAQQTFSDQGPNLEQAIADLLLRIKSEYADVIVRLDLSNQSNEDAAIQLGITVNNLTVRAHRARRALRNALETAPMFSYG